MTILKLALNIKLIVKSQETRKQNLLEKQIHVRKLHQRNQQTFPKFRYDSENDNNEKID